MIIIVKVNFRIRCKVLSQASIRYFGTNKVFDAIVCDETGEIKIAGFNESTDRFLPLISINQVNDICANLTHFIQRIFLENNY